MSLSIFVSYEPDGSPPVSGRPERRLQLSVSRLQNGADVGRQVYSKAGGELKQSEEDYMLYWPDRRIWILPQKHVGLFHLEAGAKLEYRPRKRRIKLRFLDASSKLLIADETKPVKNLVEDICEQLRITHPEELSLVVAGDYAVQKHHPAKNKSMNRSGSASPLDGRRLTLGKKEKSIPTLSGKSAAADINPPKSLSPSIRRKRPGSASGSKKYPNWSASKVKKQISKKHQIRLDTPWLDPSKTLAEQEVTESDELILMYRFYYHMQLQRHSASVEMLYKQARATYLAGELLCSPNDMVRLSAILCQISKGDYSKHKYSHDFISTIKGLIAPPKCKIKAIGKQITAQHSSLEGVTVADAKCWFIKLWSSLELFGMEFFSCTNMDTKEKGLIGVSKDKIMFLYHKNKKNTFWDVEKLTQWTHDLNKDTVSLTFSRERQSETLNLSLPDYAGVLVDCLQGHRELSDTIPDIMRAATEYQFDDEMESAISVFATQTKRDAKVRPTLSSLTYEDVYWASKIENPLLSAEELSQLKTNSWENPVFSNMDQLMDERFNFLDFGENSTEAGTQPEGNGTRHLLSPSAAQHSGPSTSPHHTANGSSPLVTSQRRVARDSGGEVVAAHQVFHNGVTDGDALCLEQSRKLSSDSGTTAGEEEGEGEGEGERLEGGAGERKDSSSGLPELTVR